MNAFTVAHVERVNHGAHLYTVTLQFGAAQLRYKVLSDRNGQPWVSGLRFGEPLRSQMRQAILAAAGYGASSTPQRPANLANIPEELRRRAQWLPYRIIDGETVFYDLHTGLPVDDPSDPRHWCSFEDVQQAVAPEGGQL